MLRLLRQVDSFRFFTRVLPAALAVAWCCGVPVRALDFYINAGGPTGDGSGSSPTNAADASTPEKYRAINESHSTPGTVIVYAPGTYEVSPAFSMYSGVTHRGAGIDSTIIKVAPGSAAGTFTPMWLANKSTVSRFTFTDATIDFNCTQAAWWARGTGCAMAFAFSTADHCTIQRVKFIHMGAKNEEAFPIFFLDGASAAGELNHNLVDACIFTLPIKSGNTKGGLTCIMMSDAEPGITTDTTNVVSHCQFLELKSPEYSDLGYAQCATAPVVIDNRAEGVDSLWFVEPGSQAMGNNHVYTGETVRVTGNTLVDSGPVAMLLMHPNGNFAGHLLVRANTVGMTEHPYFRQGARGPQGVGLFAYWDGDAAISDLVIQANTFIAPRPLRDSPCAVFADLTAPSHLFHLKSLDVSDNMFVNFPQDGRELQVTKDRSRLKSFTHAGNMFFKR